jgi:hypothetical protein
MVSVMLRIRLAAAFVPFLVACVQTQDLGDFENLGLGPGSEEKDAAIASNGGADSEADGVAAASDAAADALATDAAADVTDTAPCRDSCTAGSTKCEGSELARCERQASGCLAWSAARACAAGQSCRDGACRGPANVISLLVSPKTASVPATLTTRLEATAVYDDATSADVTASAQWTSDAPKIATVAAGGVEAIAEGTAAITARVGTVSGSATITVTAKPKLLSLSIEPPYPSAEQVDVPYGETSQFRAIATYEGRPPVDVTEKVTWSVADATVATVTQGPTGGGRLTPLRSSRTTRDSLTTKVVATLGDVGSARPFAVRPVATKLVVKPRRTTFGVEALTSVSVEAELNTGGTEARACEWQLAEPKIVAFVDRSSSWEPSTDPIARNAEYVAIRGIAVGQATLTVRCKKIVTDVPYPTLTVDTTLDVTAPPQAFELRVRNDPWTALKEGSYSEVVIVAKWADGSERALFFPGELTFSLPTNLSFDSRWSQSRDYLYFLNVAPGPGKIRVEAFGRAIEQVINVVAVREVALSSAVRTCGAGRDFTTEVIATYTDGSVEKQWGAGGSLKVSTRAADSSIATTSGGGTTVYCRKAGTTTVEFSVGAARPAVLTVTVTGP